MRFIGPAMGVIIWLTGRYTYKVNCKIVYKVIWNTKYWVNLLHEVYEYCVAVTVSIDEIGFGHMRVPLT